MVSALNIIGTDKSLQNHWAKRLIAIIVDSIIVYVIGTLMMWFAILPLNWGIPNPWIFFWPVMSGVMLFIYCMIFEATSGGATLGKRLMNLRVMPISGDMNIGKAAIRNVSKVHPTFMLLDWAIGFVTDGEPKQKWLDRVAGTTVVLTTKLSEQEQHIYQSQQSKYAPPPQEPYVATRHEPVYQYPPKQDNAPASKTPRSVEPAPSVELKCASCGGRMAETGKGRMKCIRCGKIQ
jgi:uncharacterized RDD family membrane protein YckC